eukprot:g74500.t1
MPSNMTTNPWTSGGYTYTASSDGRYGDNVLYDARLAFDNSNSTTHIGTGPYDATTGVWSGSLGVTGKTISGVFVNGNWLQLDLGRVVQLTKY